jgi:hypothetical protein
MEKISILLLAVVLIIFGGEDSAIAHTSSDVCMSGTMEESLQVLKDNPRIEGVSVVTYTDPKVIGPFLDAEIQSGALSKDFFPIDAIYVITLRLPKMVVVALSYKGCYMGSRVYQISPFIQT